MQFQGRELHIGDKLVSGRFGTIVVLAIDRYDNTFKAFLDSNHSYWWDMEGRSVNTDDDSIDATWPDPDPALDREAEYRRIWIERATSRYDFDITNRPRDELHGFAVDAFDAADAFIAELRRRDGEGK